MVKVAVIAFNHTMASAALAPADLITSANRYAKEKIQCLLLSPDGEHISCVGDTVITTQGGIEQADDADVIIVAGIYFLETDAFIKTLTVQTKLISRLQQWHQQGKLICAACTGTFFLAEAGLLDDVASTTSWWAAQDFTRRYPQVQLQANKLLVEGSDTIITAGAMNGMHALIMHIVHRFLGQNAANEANKELLININSQTEASLAPASQTEPSLAPASQTDDALVAASQQWIKQHLQQDFSVQQLADHLQVSTRTLIRHFKTQLGETPINYIQNLRVERAKLLLSQTDLSLHCIIEQIGYQDLSSFRRLFYRQTRISPQRYRAKHRSTTADRTDAPR